jgi:hypothetical protein
MTLHGDPIEVYRQVLTGQRKVFPRNYWNEPDSRKNAAIITRFMIERLLRWSLDDVRERINIEVFAEYRLRGMVATLFGEHTWKAVDNAYPGKFKPWELKGSSVGRWSRSLRIDAVRWLVEERLNLPPEHRMYVTADDFETHGLSGLLSHYGNSPAAALVEAYPELKEDLESEEVHIGIRTTRRIREMLEFITDYHNCTATEWIEKAIRSEYHKIKNPRPARS